MDSGNKVEPRGGRSAGLAPGGACPGLSPPASRA